MSPKKVTNDPRDHLEDALVLSWAAVSTKIQDKYSIEDQLKAEREWCARHGVRIVEELVVRGFSRDYWTLADVVAAAAHDPNMEAFAKLQAHIRKNTFNIFLCWDADRFGRTQSLVHEVIGRVTRDCNALIYTLYDGVWMDAESGATIGTFKAMKAQQDIDKLKDYRVTGMDNRAQDGKATSAILPLFQKKIRDEKGREIRVELNEDYRQLWTDLATVILRGVPWNLMEKILFEEFGHGQNGKPYHHFYMRHLVLHYAFWGHAALNYSNKGDTRISGVGPWLWDEHVPPPPPTTVYRNRYPAVYSGDLGEQVKAELWRRYRLTGKAEAHNTYRFHGLLMCAECGKSMSKAANGQHPERVYLRCSSRFSARYSGGVSCTQTRHIRAHDVQAYFTVQLQKRLDSLPSDLFDQLSDTDAIERRIEELERQVAKLENRNRTLVDELADAPDPSRKIFREKIADVSSQIERAEDVLDELRAQLAGKNETQQKQRQFEIELREKGVSFLWTLPEYAIHQRLAAALGDYQLVVRDGQIVGRAIAQSHHIRAQRRRPL